MDDAENASSPCGCGCGYDYGCSCYEDPFVHSIIRAVRHEARTQEPVVAVSSNLLGDNTFAAIWTLGAAPNAFGPLTVPEHALLRGVIARAIGRVDAQALLSHGYAWAQQRRTLINDTAMADFLFWQWQSSPALRMRYDLAWYLMRKHMRECMDVTLRVGLLEVQDLSEAFVSVLSDVSWLDEELGIRRGNWLSIVHIIRTGGVDVQAVLGRNPEHIELTLPLILRSMALRLIDTCPPMTFPDALRNVMAWRQPEFLTRQLARALDCSHGVAWQLRWHALALWASMHPPTPHEYRLRAPAG